MTALKGQVTSPIGFGATLTAAMAIGAFLPFALSVVAPLLIPDLGLSRTQFGSLTTAFYVVGTLLSWWAGVLVDRLGGLRVLLGTFLFASVSMVLAGMAPAYLALLGAAALGGVATATVNPVTNELIARNLERGRQGLVIGVKQSGVYVGFILAGAVLPSMALALGWRWTLVVCGAVGLLGMPATHRYVPALAAVQPTAGDSHRAVLERDVIWLALLTLLAGAALGAVTTYLPLYGYEGLGLHPQSAGLLAVTTGAAAVAGRIFLARVAERSRRARGLLLLLAVLSVLAVLLIWVARPLDSRLVWAGALLVGASAAPWTAVVYMLLVRGPFTGSTGRASGAVQLGFYTGHLSSPLAFGAVVDAVGYDLAWAGLAAACLLMAGLTLAWRPSPRFADPTHP